MSTFKKFFPIPGHEDIFPCYHLEASLFYLSRLNAVETDFWVRCDMVGDTLRFFQQISN